LIFDWYTGSISPLKCWRLSAMGGASHVAFYDPEKVSVNPATAADRFDAAGTASASCAGR